MPNVFSGSDGERPNANSKGDLRERTQTKRFSQPLPKPADPPQQQDVKRKDLRAAGGSQRNSPKGRAAPADGELKFNGRKTNGAKTNGARTNGTKTNGARTKRVTVNGHKASGALDALTTASPVEVETPKARARRLWGAGDYQAIAAHLLIIAEMLCETADLRAGQRVLDVATGTGNAALAAARRGCRTVGVDFAPSLLQRARQRATAEGLTVKLVAGDAEVLPFADNSFDVVLSTLGVMFVSNQSAAAAELLRVTRPGGKIALANWTPDGGNAMVSEIVAKYLPAVGPQAPASGGSSLSPYKWGCADGLAELLGPGAKLVQAERRSFKSRALSAAESWQAFQSRCGFVFHLMNSLDDQVRAQITKEVVAASEAMNTSGDGTLLVAQGYLEAVAVKAGG